MVFGLIGLPFEVMQMQSPASSSIFSSLPSLTREMQ